MNCNDPNSVSWSSAIINMIFGLLINLGRFLWLFFMRNFFARWLWLNKCLKCFLTKNFLRNKPEGTLMASRSSQLLEPISASPWASFRNKIATKQTAENNQKVRNELESICKNVVSSRRSMAVLLKLLKNWVEMSSFNHYRCEIWWQIQPRLLASNQIEKQNLKYLLLVLKKFYQVFCQFILVCKVQVCWVLRLKINSLMMIVVELWCEARLASARAVSAMKNYWEPAQWMTAQKAQLSKLSTQNATQALIWSQLSTTERVCLLSAAEFQNSAFAEKSWKKECFWLDVHFVNNWVLRLLIGCR